jgi:hypothetical protein
MTDLTEDQARSMEAGDELDRACAEWIGCELGVIPGGETYSSYEIWTMPDGNRVFDNAPPYSTDWSAAGPLLEAMQDMDGFDVSVESHLDGWTVRVTSGLVYMMPREATAPTPQLAIARACAVLVARGITREEVEGE